MPGPAVFTLIYEYNIIRFNNIALSFMTFCGCVCVLVCPQWANRGNVIGYPLPNNV